MRKHKENVGKSPYASGFRPLDLNYFEPLQIRPREQNRDSFDDAVKVFKSVVQKEKILSLYKEKQTYEKPSVKKRRKRREAEERRISTEIKAKLIQSGEWDKRQKRKLRNKENKEKQKLVRNE